MMLDDIDRLSSQIVALDAKIEQAIAPFARPGQPARWDPQRSVPPPHRS